MKKVIGIAAWRDQYKRKLVHEINENFARGVSHAGGLPLILPMADDPAREERTLDAVDGLILIGGADIFPFYYGQEMHEKIPNVDKERDRSEMRLFRRAMERGIPVFGICRGMQIANVALGGTLVQDIPTEVPGALIHSSPVRSSGADHRGFRINYHNIFVEKDSRLHSVVGDRLVVNSFHHQCIRELGKGLKVAARSADGIVEAVESVEGTLFFGVQFHPEFTQHNELFSKMFEYFVREVEKAGEAKE